MRGAAPRPRGSSAGSGADGGAGAAAGASSGDSASAAACRAAEAAARAALRSARIAARSGAEPALNASKRRRQIALANRAASGRLAACLGGALDLSNTGSEAAQAANCLGSEGARVLAQALGESRVCGLSLRGHAIFAQGGAALAEALRGNARLRELDLARNSLGDAGAEALAAVLASHDCVLERLCLSQNALGRRGCNAIAAALEVNTLLVALDVRDNALGREGGLRIARMLGTNRTLRALDVTRCKLGDTASCTIADALAQPEAALRSLALGQNDLGILGARAFASALASALAARTSRLTSLDIRGSRIGPEGAKVLARALRRNLTLTALVLLDNGIGMVGAKALAEMLRCNAALRLLDLRANRLGVLGAGLFGESLKTNVALIFLRIARDPRRDVAVLGEMLHTNRVYLPELRRWLRGMLERRTGTLELLLLLSARIAAFLKGASRDPPDARPHCQDRQDMASFADDDRTDDSVDEEAMLDTESL